LNQRFSTKKWAYFSMIKGILFDKDGTLLEFDSTQHYIYANVLSNLKDRYQIPDLLLRELWEVLGLLPERLTPDSLLQFSTNPQIAKALFVSSKRYAAEHNWHQPYKINELLELIEELSIRDDVPYTALPNVPETLSYLKHRDYKLGVATVDTFTATVAGLKKTGIFDYFDYLGTGEESKPKPDTFLADKFCNQCHIKPCELLIVGDGKNDMLFAENVGAYFIGIDTLGNDTSFFKANGYKSVSNIIEIIDELHF